MIHHLLAITVLACSLGATLCLNNGLARRPPMGWIAWERFTCEVDCANNPDDCINEKLFKDMADHLVHDGYQAVGYEYVNIDDCWSEFERDADQKLVANRSRFPNGIADLAQYIHYKNLKFGIYGDCGVKTCAGYPSQLKTEDDYEDNYFQTDADSMADWGVDSFKFDGCNIDPFKAESICPRMAAALSRANRSILLTCEWPVYLSRHGGHPDWKLAAENCNLWRYTEDVEDDWLSILSIVDLTVANQRDIAIHHGPGGWFDPDQIIIGNFALSFEQAQTQMALWSIWSAPLLMSNDLRNIDPAYAAILKNKEVIEIDQDPLGVLGLMVDQNDDKSIQAFVKPIMEFVNGCPSFAVVYFNRNQLGNGRVVSFKVRDLLRRSGIRLATIRYKEAYPRAATAVNADTCLNRLTYGMTMPTGLIVGHDSGVEHKNFRYQVRDLLENRDLGEVALDSVLELRVNPSGVRMVKLTEIW